MRDFQTIHVGAPLSVQEDAIAAIVLNCLRRDGLEPEQVLAWCNDRTYDSDFELSMHQEHGIDVSAERIKHKVAMLVTGPVRVS